MQFSIRDLATSTALLSFYLAVLTRLSRELFFNGQSTAAIGAGVVLVIVLANIAFDEGRYRLGDDRRLLRVYRSQNWLAHYAIAAPLLTLGVAALAVPFNGFGTMMTLYLVLCAFAVHLFVCTTPLASFTAVGVTIGRQDWPWKWRRIRLLEDDRGAALQVGDGKPVRLPADRVEQVRKLLDEWLPDAPTPPPTTTPARYSDAIPSP